MQIINSSLARDIWAALKPQLNAFGELAHVRGTELHNSADGIHVYRKCDLMSPLAIAPEPPSDMSAMRVAGGNWGSIVLSFDTSHCLLVQDTVPAVASSRLFELLRFANVRDVPLAAKDYIWGHNVLEREGQTLRVQRVILARNRFEPMLRSLRDEGLQCDAIVFRDRGSSCLPIALTPDGDQFAHYPFKNWNRAAGIGAVVLLLSTLTFMGVLNWKQGLAMESANAMQSKLSEDVAKFTAKFQAAKSESQVLQKLLGRKQNIPSQAKILEELAHVIPDSAFITSYSGENQKVSIEGSASDPEALISLLDSSELFTDVHFSAPSLRNPGERQAHFSIQLNISNVDEG